MSATTATATTATDYADRLNLADIVARIERQQEETRKFVAEQHKLAAEASKVTAEQHKFASEAVKLASEAAKLNRDRSLSPWLAGGAVAGGILTGATLLLRALGVLS